MQEHSVLEIVRKAVNSQRVQQEQVISSGVCKSFEEYKYALGKLAGMDIALEVVLSSLKKEFED